MIPEGIYGARRIFGDLREAGEQCGLYRIERMMRVNGIKPIRGYKEPRSIAGGALDHCSDTA
jgi:putative transposase